MTDSLGSFGSFGTWFKQTTPILIVSLLPTPLERVQLLLQNQADIKFLRKPYKGMIDTFVRVPREQGFFSLWRGNMGNILNIIPRNASTFLFNDFYRQNIPKLFGLKRESSFLTKLTSNLASGGAAGATALLVTYPLTFSRVRLGLDVGRGVTREFNGHFDAIRTTVKKGGLYGRGSLLSGILPSIFMLGYGVSLLAGLIAYPLSTISRRLILDAGNTSLKYSSVLQCARSIMKEKGIRGMWAGAGVNILHGITGSLSLILYDAVFRPIFYRK